MHIRSSVSVGVVFTPSDSWGMLIPPAHHEILRGVVSAMGGSDLDATLHERKGPCTCLFVGVGAYPFTQLNGLF